MEPDTIGDKRDNRQPDGTFGPGNNANPNGRPPGTSIKDRVRKFLEENPDDMRSFIEHFAKKDRALAWQMLEGRPSQGIGQAEDLPPLPLLGGLSVDKPEES